MEGYNKDNHWAVFILIFVQKNAFFYDFYWCDIPPPSFDNLCVVSWIFPRPTSCVNFKCQYNFANYSEKEYVYFLTDDKLNFIIKILFI